MTNLTIMKIILFKCYYEQIIGVTAEYPATLSLDCKRVATRYAVSDIYKSASCLNSWLRGTRYAVSDIYKRGSNPSSWLRGTRYAVSDMYKRGSYLSSWVRGTGGTQ